MSNDVGENHASKLEVLEQYLLFLLHVSGSSLECQGILQQIKVSGRARHTWTRTQRMRLSICDVFLYVYSCSDRRGVTAHIYTAAPVSVFHGAVRVAARAAEDRGRRSVDTGGEDEEEAKLRGALCVRQETGRTDALSVRYMEVVNSMCRIFNFRPLIFIIFVTTNNNTYRYTYE